MIYHEGNEEHERILKPIIGIWVFDKMPKMY